MRTVFAAIVCGVALTLTPGSGRAAQPPVPQPSSSPPPVRAARLESPVKVDGILSEPVWQNGNAASEFHQRDPAEGGTPSQRTEVRVAYDDDAIYVGARMYDTAPDSVTARLSRRDVFVPADRFSVYLDPFHDRRSGYYFTVNAAGTLSDGTVANDGQEDDSWDGVWEGKARRDDQGWTAEFRIPFSQLRFEKSAEYVWGVNFYRNIPRRAEHVFLVFQPKNGSGFVSRFPELVGIANVRSGRSLELVPYVTTKASYLQPLPGDPFHDDADYVADGGADLRTGVGSRMTLNATVNPDFGQVEVDPAVVNLSDVETYYPEKRPFFVEGLHNFRFGNEGANSYWGFNWPEPTFFYSRRVGRPPQGEIPDSEFVDAPAGTTILGAAKLTGKLTPSWNLGVLSVLTGREHASLGGNGPPTQIETEPLTFYGAARGLKEFPGRRAGLGFIGTAVARSFDEPQLRDQLNSASYVTGIDGWLFLDRDKDWVLSGYSALSHVRGTTERMTALQEDARHYLHRPDARNLGVDPEATSLTGFVSRYWLNRQNGNMIFNAAAGFLSPKFDVNDLGYQSRADLINVHAGGGYKWTRPGRHRRYSELLGAAFGSFDFDGNRVSNGFFASGYTEYLNNAGWGWQAMYLPPCVSNRRTRGGPLMLTKAGYLLETDLNSDNRAAMMAELHAEFEHYPSMDTYGLEFMPEAEWKPASNVIFSFGPGFAQIHEDAQYVTTVEDPLATDTYGRRYVFARLQQTEVSGNFRLNWAFSPTLSLQLYVQPLISTGDYEGFKELARPKSYDFRQYAEGTEYDPATGTVDPDGPAGPAPPFSIGQPDFNFTSLRGNAVFRWEFRPGSAFYLVWTQERVDEQPTGDFTFGPSVDQMFSADADNILMAKVTYYLGF